MENKLPLDYFDTAIHNLVNTLGIAEPVDNKELVGLVKQKDYEGCINKIASTYGLPARFSIKIVPKGYSAKASHFKTAGLSRTDDQGRGVEGITAQVRIPGNIPLFGDSRLNNFLIDAIVGEECSDYPNTFIFIMAHEVAHVLLKVLLHPEENNEFYVDLVPLVMGFSKIAERGRKTTEVVDYSENTTTYRTTTHGYLSDSQFNYSIKKIGSILNDYKHQIKFIEKRTKQLKITAEKLEHNLDEIAILQKDILQHGKKRIKLKDTQILVRLYDIGYNDHLKRDLENTQDVLDKYDKNFGNIQSYNKLLLDQLNDNIIMEHIRQLKASLAITENDLSLLRRNLKLSYKIKRLF